MKLNPKYIYYILLYDYLKQTNKMHEFVINEQSVKIKNHYLDSFKQLLTKQIQKYIDRDRIDKEIKNINLKNASVGKLYTLIKKTYRSDMQRRNVRWEKLAELLVDLKNQKQSSNILEKCDRINNLVHNTRTSMLDKFDNWKKVLEAFEFAFSKKSNLRTLRIKISKELRTDLKESKTSFNKLYNLIK